MAETQLKTLKLDDFMKYIPQAAPFEMIDELLWTKQGESQSSLKIDLKNLFAVNGSFIEAGLIENMAQTAAAGMGYEGEKEQKTPTVGYIGQIKNLQIFQLPKTGSTIITTTKTIHQVMNAIVVQAEVALEQKTIATAEFKIFLQYEKV